MTYQEAFSSSPNCFDSDPYLPFTLLKNTTCQTKDWFNEYDVTIRLNNLGYRGQDFTEEKLKGGKRVLVLGDSFTFGIGEKDEEVYPFLLEKILQKKLNTNIDVVNAGYADGFSPDSYYAYLKQRGISLSPDLIVLELYPWNDISDLAETVWTQKNNDGLPVKVQDCCAVVDGGRWRNKQINFKYAYPLLRDSELFQLIINTLSLKLNIFKDPKSTVAKNSNMFGCTLVSDCVENFKEEEQKVYKVLSAIKATADEHGVPFLIVLFPADYQLYPNYAGKYIGLYPLDMRNPDFIQKRLRSELDKLGIEYLDLYPIFDNPSVRTLGIPYFFQDAHFNALGHKLTAEAIYSYIEKNKLLN